MLLSTTTVVALSFCFVFFFWFLNTWTWHWRKHIRSRCEFGFDALKKRKQRTTVRRERSLLNDNMPILMVIYWIDFEHANYFSSSFFWFLSEKHREQYPCSSDNVFCFLQTRRNQQLCEPNWTSIIAFKLITTSTPHIHLTPWRQLKTIYGAHEGEFNWLKPFFEVSLKTIENHNNRRVRVKLSIISYESKFLKLAAAAINTPSTHQNVRSTSKCFPI